MFTRIVVSLDGSETAEQALAPATDLATRLQVPLHLLRVADIAWLSMGAPDVAMEYAALGETINDEEQSARDYLGALATKLAADGLTITTEVRTGFAAREIIAAIQPTDLLAMASHGRTGPARWLLGSVAEDVTRRSAAPVLLVRAVEPDDKKS